MVGEMNYTQTLKPKTLPSLLSPAHQNMTMGGRVKDVYMNGNYISVHGKDIHACMKHDGLTIQTH